MTCFYVAALDNYLECVTFRLSPISHGGWTIPPTLPALKTGRVGGLVFQGVSATRGQRCLGGIATRERRLALRHPHVEVPHEPGRRVRFLLADAAEP